MKWLKRLTQRAADDESRQLNAWQQTVFSSYDLPVGRTAESFKWHIGVIWSGSVVDEYWTDNDDAKDRVVRESVEEGYTTRVVQQLSAPVAPS